MVMCPNRQGMDNGGASMKHTVYSRCHNSWLISVATENVQEWSCEGNAGHCVCMCMLHLSIPSLSWDTWLVTVPVIVVWRCIYHLYVVRLDDSLFQYLSLLFLLTFINTWNASYVWSKAQKLIHLSKHCFALQTSFLFCLQTSFLFVLKREQTMMGYHSWKRESACV